MLLEGILGRSTGRLKRKRKMKRWFDKVNEEINALGIGDLMETIGGIERDYIPPDDN